ncbi:hypothetical protein H8R13_04055 [Morganella morganii]|uniref:hypothetical protein n=1 Tax=Morganella morganii TaxID=582 RepID=UPI00164BE621|nr:hypothetical protein [Morganella morganii]MBC4010913.1 hypothetical protein [Morganella morganii]MCF1266412.1 hypothetical protein [Morganella morganii]
MVAITAAGTQTQVDIPESNGIPAKNRDLPEINTNPDLINEITKNGNIKTTGMTDEQIGEEIRSRVADTMPSLLSGNDEKWLKLAIELCKVMNDDSLSQQERQNKLDTIVIELAKKLKEMKYKEGELQLKAAISGALISIGIAVAGAALSIKGVSAANPTAPTACGIAGQAISGLSQPISQVFVQIVQKKATELQGDAEVVRAQKDLKLKTASTHGRASDELNELKKRMMSMSERYLDNKLATANNLLNNMRG